MKRAKKQKSSTRKKYTLSDKQLLKVKEQVTNEAVTMTGMLYLAALAEKGWTEDQIVEMFDTISRYVKYIDDNVVKIKHVQEVIEKHTGMKIKYTWNKTGGNNGNRI